MEEVDFRILTLDDVIETKKFLSEHYATREPLFCHLKSSPEEFWGYYETKVEACLSPNVSIGAFGHTSGRMCGVLLNTLGRAKSSRYPPFGSQSLKVRQILKAFEVTVKGGYAAGVGTDNYLRMNAAAVEPGYVNRGILTELMRRTCQIAEQLSCSNVVIDITSEYTRRAATKLGFEVKKQIFYKDYVDPITGQKIFEGMAKPHISYSWMMKKVQKAGMKVGVTTTARPSCKD